MAPKIRLALGSILAVAALGAIAPAANAYTHWTNTDGGFRSDRQFLSSDSSTSEFCWRYACGNVSPSSHDFGNQLVSSGATSSATVTLTGTGHVNNLTIPANGIVLIGTDADQFQITGGTCSAGSTSLPQYQSCTVTVAFNPSSAGSKSASLGVDTNDGGKYTALTGIGTAPSGSLSPSYSAFGSRIVSAGPSSAVAFTLVSNSSVDLTIPADGINLTGTDSGQFQITGGTCSAASTSLTQGQSCTVSVAFDPTSIGAKLATLDVQTNDGTKTATITGTGTAEPTISGVGKPTKTSLKVKVGCGDENACTVRLTGKKVGTKAAITPETLFVPAGQQPTVTLAYSRALKAALARGGRVNVTVTNPVSGGVESIVVRVAR
jgi:hypothetical protein